MTRRFRRQRRSSEAQWAAKDIYVVKRLRGIIVFCDRRFHRCVVVFVVVPVKIIVFPFRFLAPNLPFSQSLASVRDPVATFLATTIKHTECRVIVHRGFFLFGSQSRLKTLTEGPPYRRSRRCTLACPLMPRAQYTPAVCLSRYHSGNCADSVGSARNTESRTRLLALTRFITFITGSLGATYHGVYLGELGDGSVHGVSGKVYLSSKNEIHLVDFNYDGAGPDAFFMIVKEGNPGGEGIKLQDETGS